MIDMVSFFNWTIVDNVMLVSDVQHSQCLDTLENHHRKSSNQLFPYGIITILLTIFLMLYITFSWLTYFIAVNSYFLISIAYFTHSAPSSGSPSLASVCKTLFTFCFVGSFVLYFRPHKWDHLIFVFVSHLSLYSLDSSMLSQMTRFYLFMVVAASLTYSSSIQ